MVTLLVAHDENKLIGRKQGLPWQLPEDLKLFKQRTQNNVVVMGLKTYCGLPVKPLRNRVNIVVMMPDESREFIFPKNDERTITIASHGITDAIGVAKSSFPGKEIFICGGASIYAQSLKQGLVDRMFISVVDGSHEGDVYFPEIYGEWKWKVVEQYDQFRVEEWIKI